MSRILNTTLPPPEKPSSLPLSAQWLAGEGAGSWFHLIPAKGKGCYRISRYSPEGFQECIGLFYCIDWVDFSVFRPFKFEHLSHCKTVRVVQNQNVFTFERRSD